MAKDTHLDLRLDEHEKQRITRAACLTGDTTSHFVLAAATAAANRVIADNVARTLMPAEQFDELTASLEIPDEAPNLARLFATGKEAPWRSEPLR
jgi:uncharacterized protein (DUF1778 family)